MGVCSYSFQLWLHHLIIYSWFLVATYSFFFTQRGLAFLCIFAKHDRHKIKNLLLIRKNHVYYILINRKDIWLGRNEFQNVVVLEHCHEIAMKHGPILMTYAARWGRAQLLSRAGAAFHTLTSSAQGSQLLHSFTSTWFFKIITILVGVKQYLIVDFICTYLTMFSVIFYNYCPFVYILWTNAYLYMICPVIIDL